MSFMEKNNSDKVNDNQYILYSYTEKGDFRKNNQDACYHNILKTPSHTVVLAAVCDGVGGLSEGAFISNDTVSTLDGWFKDDLQFLIDNNEENLFSALQSDLKELIEDQNIAMVSYGKAHNIKMGTTLTLMLILDNQYFIIQIGDSRGYLLSKQLIQLTEDQSLVAQELREGKISLEEARVDKRRNIILQCLGRNNEIIPYYYVGKIESKSLFFLCSDGFIKELEDDEIKKYLAPKSLMDERVMQSKIDECINLVRSRGEKDNATVVLINII